jgi:hypothetical protein
MTKSRVTFARKEGVFKRLKLITAMRRNPRPHRISAMSFRFSNLDKKYPIKMKAKVPIK